MPLLDFATIPIWLQGLAYVYLIGGIKHDEMCINITILYENKFGQGSRQ
jgi:hypothetical protein